MSAIKTQFDAGAVVLKDATAVTPLSVTIPIDNADLAISGLRDALRDVGAYQSRGQLRGLRKTARVFPTFSLSMMVTEFTDATVAAATVLDFLFRKAGTDYAAAESTSSVIGDVFTCDLTFTQEGTDYGDDADGTLTLEDCVITVDFAEGDPNKITLNGTVYGGVTGDIAIDPTA